MPLRTSSTLYKTAYKDQSWNEKNKEMFPALSIAYKVYGTVMTKSSLFNTKINIVDKNLGEICHLKIEISRLAK
jgi:ABC-type lipoprotein release transport system permease subunit